MYDIYEHSSIGRKITAPVDAAIDLINSWIGGSSVGRMLGFNGRNTERGTTHYKNYLFKEMTPVITANLHSKQTKLLRTDEKFIEQDVYLAAFLALKRRNKLVRSFNSAKRVVLRREKTSVDSLYVKEIEVFISTDMRRKILSAKKDNKLFNIQTKGTARGCFRPRMQKFDLGKNNAYDGMLVSRIVKKRSTDRSPAFHLD